MKEDIIQMARDSGMELYGLGKNRERFVHHLHAFAELVAASEREACAHVCETAYIPDGSPEDMAAINCAKAIRQRGEK